MRNKIIGLSIVVLLTSCTTYDDTTPKETESIEDSEVAAATNTDNGEKHATDTKTVERSEYYKTPQGMLELEVKKWNSLNTTAKKNESYQYLMSLEQKGDIAYAEENYGRAWHMYSSAHSNYPSPKLAVKAGDALMFRYAYSANAICKCDKSMLTEDGRLHTINLDSLKRSIKQEYGLALDFHRYPKTGYRHEQSLTPEQEAKLVEKLQCLDKKLAFEGQMEKTSVLAECVKVQEFSNIKKDGYEK